MYPIMSTRLHADERETDCQYPPLQMHRMYNKAAAPANTKARRPPATFTCSAPEELVSLAAAELPDAVPELEVV